MRNDPAIQAVLVAAALALSVCAQPARAAMEATCEASPAEITIGDRIDLTVRVRGASSLQLFFPSDKSAFLPFEILERFPQEQGEGGRLARYRLTCFETGELAIPSLEIPYSGPDGTGVMKTEPVAIRIQSVLPDDASDIKAIKGPAQVPVEWTRIVTFAGILLAALAASGYVAWKRAHSHKAVFEEAETDEPLSARDWALRELEILAASAHLRDGRVKPFYIRVGEIIKGYLGMRFSFDALDMTTGEIERFMASRRDPERFVNQVSSLLKQADLVKFARFVPQAACNHQILEEAFTIVKTDAGQSPQMDEGLRR